MGDQQDLSFWEHLDVLRASIIKMVAVTAVCGIAAFCLKETLFEIVLAPKYADFITYRILRLEPFDIQLVNIGLTEQFMVHMKTALFFGILCASPYIVYLLYKFISPALYAREKYYGVRIVGGGYAMFMIGVMVDYFLIFPLTLRFLGTYQVSSDVHTMLSLQSYMNTLFMMSLVFGIVFEIPVISWLLALFGVLKADGMRCYRKHAIVAILFVAAIITPTSDAFTLIIVSLPIWLLYEVSIWIVQGVSPKTIPDKTN